MCKRTLDAYTAQGIRGGVMGQAKGHRRRSRSVESRIMSASVSRGQLCSQGPCLSQATGATSCSGDPRSCSGTNTGSARASVFETMPPFLTISWCDVPRSAVASLPIFEQVGAHLKAVRRPVLKSPTLFELRTAGAQARNKPNDGLLSPPTIPNAASTILNTSRSPWGTV